MVWTSWSTANLMCWMVALWSIGLLSRMGSTACWCPLISHWVLPRCKYLPLHKRLRKTLQGLWRCVSSVQNPVGWCLVWGSHNIYIGLDWGLSSSMNAMDRDWPGVEDWNPTARCTSFSLQAWSDGGATTAWKPSTRGFPRFLRPHENLPEYQ